jgi:membrane protease YdiL (CAAX protease family)
MHEAVPIQAPEPPPPPTTWVGVLHGVAVWLVIAGLAAFVAYKSRAQGPGAAPVAGRPGTLETRIEGRYIIAAHEFGALNEEEVRGTLKGPRLAVVLGEISGPEAALEELKEAKGDEAALLRRLYKSGQPDALSEEEKAQLREQLGWYGDLALAGVEDEARHDQMVAEARRMLVALVVLLACGVLGLLAGGVLLIVMVALAATRRITPTITEGRSLVYAETFALYLAVYLGLSYLAGWGVRAWGLYDWKFGLMGAAMLLSLVVLVWPMLRGVSWVEMCQDVGLSSRSPLTDLAAGVGTYLCAMPLVATALILVLVVSAVAKRLGVPLSPPSHPVGNLAEESQPWWVWAQVVLVASVLAPVVEEIIFRGALYTHLRRLLPGVSPYVGVVFAALVSSFVFAIIHPQGWLFVPVLGALACTFCLAREVRGSLLPGIVAHGINNSVAMLLLIFVVS